MPVRGTRGVIRKKKVNPQAVCRQRCVGACLSAANTHSQYPHVSPLTWARLRDLARAHYQLPRLSGPPVSNQAPAAYFGRRSLAAIRLMRCYWGPYHRYWWTRNPFPVLVRLAWPRTRPFSLPRAMYPVHALVGAPRALMLCRSVICQPWYAIIPLAPRAMTGTRTHRGATE